MYDLLEISNFRCFKELSMELKPITLIAGKNNTGKSSILEALFLYHDYANPDVFIKLVGFRGVKQIEVSPRSLWEPLFRNMIATEPMILRKNGDSALRIEKNKGFALSNSGQNTLDGKIDVNSANYALACVFLKDGKDFFGDYLISSENLNKAVILLAHANTTLLPNDEYIQYFGPHIRLGDNQVVDLFGQVELAQHGTAKKKLLDVLSILGESIVDVTTISAGGLVQLYFTNKQGVKMPIQTVGDGIGKLLHIALIMLTKPGSILLLDEVENGLHYTLHGKFWEMIASLAIQEKCQIVATTHSYECISGALEGIKATGLEEEFAYVRLDKVNETVVPKTYTSDMLERALEKDWEVR
jgi:energy-coupling factor transporter ATP-binding protein EcfA2